VLDFDGTNDRAYGNDFGNNLGDFFTQRGGLGFPGSSNPQNPVANYAGITQRGLQFWARPDSKPFGTVRQDLVNDTYQFGVYTTDSSSVGGRRWAMTWGSENDDQVDGITYESQTAVVANGSTWTHVMQHSFGFGGAALYVNGVAVRVAGFDGFSGYRIFNGNAPTPPNLDLMVGGSLPVASGGTVANFYDGRLDDLKIYVAGNNTGRDPVVPEITLPGQNYGTFFLGTDNDFIAQAMSGKPDGDFDLDGDVDNTDVSMFIAKWGQTRTVNGVVIGDLTSRQTLGDFNYNGRVDLGDWALLRKNHPTPAALDLSALLAANVVPEPGALLIAALGVAGSGIFFRTRGRKRL
jgi:hypothetical protein